MRHRPALMLVASLLATVIAVAGAPAQPVDFPTKTVRIIVPYSPGGSPDAVLRVVTHELQTLWKQSVVLENRPGGNTIPGTQVVTRAPGDGHTLLFTTDGTFILNPLIYSNLPYSMSELVPVLLVASAPHMVAVTKSLNAKNVKDFVARAKASPHGLTYGSTGSLSLQRLAMDQFARATGIKLSQIPYKGAPETTTAVIAGEISASVNSIATIMPLVNAGSVDTIGLAARTRSSQAPDVPTLLEQGVDNVFSQGMFGLFAPASLPDATREKIRADVLSITSRPEIKRVLERRGYEVRTEDATAFTRLIDAESARLKRLMTDLNIQASP